MAGKIYFNSKTGKNRSMRLITLALAAALILALGVGAWAAYDKITGPEAAERVALQELEVWKELGLISQEVSADRPAAYIKAEPERRGNDYWYGRFFPRFYDVRFSDTKYHVILHVDTLTGRILFATICAQPDATDEPVAAETFDSPIDPNDLSKGFRMKTAYFCNNFDDIFPADLTVDGFCSRLADYWGFSGYRIADTEDNYVPEYEKHWEAVDGSTLLKDLPKLNPTNYYLTVFFDGDQEGAPMYLELGNYPTYVALSVGNGHSIG